jgi:hypothetical protein
LTSVKKKPNCYFFLFRTFAFRPWPGGGLARFALIFGRKGGNGFLLKVSRIDTILINWERRIGRNGHLEIPDFRLYFNE